MKKGLLFFLLLVSFVGFGQCPTVIFSTQAQIDEFSTLYPNCTNILNFTISGPDIVDLSGLSQVREVGITLTIENNPLLETLDGLENIEFLSYFDLSKNLIIRDNPSLVSLGSNLIGSDEMRSVEIKNNPNLLNLDGIGNVNLIGNLYIRESHSLINLQGLEGVTHLGYLGLNTNNSLTSIQGLNNVTMVESSIPGDYDLGFEFHSNPLLQSINGLFAETSVLQYIYITDNDSLINLEGLEVFQTFFGPSIYIEGNDNLEDISHLSSVDFQVCSTIGIKDNPKLLSLSAFSSLGVLGGYFYIENNDSLENLEGFENVVFDTVDQIKIIENDLLNDISAIKNSDLSTDDLVIVNNPLLSLCGLPSICNYLNNGGQATIQNNGFYCNDEAAILEACSLGLNSISGSIVYDFDENGCDISDIKVSSAKIEITDGNNTFSIFPDSNGRYLWFVDEGSYTVSIDPYSLPQGIISSPEDVIINFITSGETEIADFCLSTVEEYNDATITLMPITLAVPGFDGEYQLIYENFGSTTLSGNITFQFDSSLQTFLDAIPAPTTINGNEVSWDFIDLLPFQNRTIILNLNNLPPPINNSGDVLSFEAIINPSADDSNSENNTYNLNQIVVNSFDPNDKQVNQGEEIYENETGNYLDYMVRFQNTGTADAINVRIEDVLSDKLNWNTFRPLTASHEYRVEILDGNNVSFIFDNINLPPEMSDPEGSNGFVAFQLKPVQNIALGDVIENTADIYFDFNAAIVTNTVSTTVVENLGVDEFSLDTLAHLYPNPISSTLNIKTARNISFEKAKVYSTLGKLILETSEKQINLETLSAGIYFVEVVTDKGSVTKKILKE